MVLTGKAIWNRLNHVDPSRRLHVLPLGQLRVDFQAASIDVHLGQHFLIPAKSSAGYLDPARPASGGGRSQSDCTALAEGTLASRGAVDPVLWEHHLERLSVPINGELFLHPRHFALASVYEYIKVPKDLCADVVGRSTWARVGLVVAMATFVHPGYSGCLTLELQNLGEMPIRLRPGLRVAQLVFRETIDRARSDNELAQQPWSAGQLACSYAPEYWPVISPDDRELLRQLDVWP